MIKYKIPVSWEVCGMIEVEVEDGVSLEEAIEKAIEQDKNDEISLPESEYIEGSFKIETDSEYVQIFNN